MLLIVASNKTTSGQQEFWRKFMIYTAPVVVYDWNQIKYFIGMVFAVSTPLSIIAKPLALGVVIYVGILKYRTMPIFPKSEERESVFL